VCVLSPFKEKRFLFWLLLMLMFFLLLLLGFWLSGSTRRDMCLLPSSLKKFFIFLHIQTVLRELLIVQFLSLSFPLFILFAGSVLVAAAARIAALLVVVVAMVVLLVVAPSLLLLPPSPPPLSITRPLTNDTAAK